MKHTLIAIIFTSVLLGSSSFAQSQSTSSTWFGTSASLHYFIPSIDLHIGVEDALGENIDLRTTLSGVAIDGGGFVSAGINGIVNLSEASSTTNSYIGFGPRGVLLFDPGVSNNIVAFGVGGLWGTEFFTNSSSSPFVEFNATLPISAGGEFVPAFLPIISLTTGVNFHF